MIKHGTLYGYRHQSCRCDECHRAQRDYYRASKDKARSHPVPERAHGTHSGYDYYGCRCDPCKSANRERGRAYREAKKDGMNAPIPSHHMDSKIEPGTVFESYRNGVTRTIIETMRREDRMFVAICTNHGYSSKPTPYRETAHRSARFPQGWCEGCQKLLGIHFPAGFGKPAGNARQCELCDAFSPQVMSCGHADSAGSILVCPECRKGEPYEKLYTERFGELVKTRRKEWSGMSKRERRQALKRMAMRPKKGE